MDFDGKVDKMLEESRPVAQHDSIVEGMLLSINKIISDTIRVPEGDYIVAVVDGNVCTLVAAESAKDKFEVIRPTLAGFFSPEVHIKTVDNTTGPAILESGK